MGKKKRKVSGPLADMLKAFQDRWRPVSFMSGDPDRDFDKELTDLVLAAQAQAVSDWEVEQNKVRGN